MDKQQRKHLIIASVVAAVIGLGALGTSFRLSSSQSTRYSSWMASLDDAATLQSLTLPGSHDSGAYYSLADLAGKCQDLSIEEQLNDGVRFLDVRLEASENTLYVCHGPINEGASFATVLKTVAAFLKDNPTETVLLSVKEEAKASLTFFSFDELVNQEIGKYPTSIYVGRELPSSLKEVRGKMVFFSRYAGNSIGVDCYGNNEWQDPSDAASPNSFDLSISAKLHVQDHYKLKDNATKWEEALAGLTYAESHPDTLTLNFFSGYLVSSFPPSYSVSTAKVINPKIKAELPSSRKGVLIMDFITADLVASVLEGTL
jgi:1-phosphatidylinositol phosphodiesterase